MDIKEIIYKTEQQFSLTLNPEYFKYIFKKTEKIVCAVLFVTKKITNESIEDENIHRVESAAHALLDVSFIALRAQGVTRLPALRDVQFTLLELESRLRVLLSLEILHPDLFHVFENECDLVYRTVASYLDSSRTVFKEPTTSSESPARHPFTGTSASPSTHADVANETRPQPRSSFMPKTVPSPSGTRGSDRRERVLSILKDKENASIKDISDAFPECGEKTIQRILTDLIKDNLVIRIGERRWSRYRVA